MAPAICLSSLLAAAMLAKKIAQERANRTVGLMQVMGVPSGVLWAAWIAVAVVIDAAIAASVSLTLWYGALIGDTSPTILWCVTMAWLLSLKGLCLLVTGAFETGPKLAAFAVPCAVLLGLLPRYVVNGSANSLVSSDEIRGGVVSCLLASPTAFVLALDSVFNLEAAGYATTWADLFNGRSILSWATWAMVIDGALYTFMAIFLRTWRAQCAHQPRHTHRVWYTASVIHSRWIGPLAMACMRYNVPEVLYRAPWRIIHRPASHRRSRGLGSGR